MGVSIPILTRFCRSIIHRLFPKTGVCPHCVIVHPNSRIICAVHSDHAVRFSEEEQGAGGRVAIFNQRRCQVGKDSEIWEPFRPKRRTGGKAAGGRLEGDYAMVANFSLVTS